ncbi:dihydroxyacetone kinase subunit DhaL [Pediococcus ethanolidurans]|uniref:dihydroxyacetone kinase subunit DhaL n=1 Tax=Pediococcus ethanolidurans TaxID=319653 RepID=UPI001C1EACA9|nr:dihydroxyacetone kinase subunit DhaL [Pediococcus ethanolidurans]MBU7555182.1 dihydroxyacetone kinase subunit L [Pediococcus ethanolidurans]MCV3316250.1 dihydroxyacetone kinase subunit DhaL [Pediococcus ethanolidurans]
MLNGKNTKEWIFNFAKKIENNKTYLSELDTPIGDGDHGNNMARGMEAVNDALSNTSNNDLTTVFKTIAMALISKVGGASGPLYGTAFLEMAKESNNSTDLSDLLSVALIGIKKRGGANVGDKTMIDVWDPVLTAIKSNSLTQQTIDKAVDNTKNMIARKGRASYLGERSVGHLDPGAVSSGYLFSALLETEGIL